MSLSRTILTGVSCAALMAGGAAMAEGDTLTVFDWAGYEDPNFFPAYVEKHGDAPDFAYFADEEEAFQKLRSGFVADVVHPCSQSVPKWMEAGLLEPIDTSRIDRWDELEPAFRDIEAYQKDGEHYFVPAEWGNSSIVYNTDLLNEEDVQSLQAFADPKHRGRISIDDNVDDAYALAFLSMGISDWSDVSDEQFQEASAFLRKVHKNVRAYWTDGSSLTQLMQSGEVYFAWAWNETFATMHREGYPIANKRDTDEGSSSWVCGYSKLASGEGSDDKFYDFINAWLEPEVADFIVTEWGYGHANKVAMDEISDDVLKSVGLETSEEMRKNTLWQSPVPSELREKMISEFELIKAGF